MSSIITITTGEIGGQTVRTVNARDLHEFLESKQEFANWIKGRIDQYSFVKDQDFTVDKFINGRATQIDYHISVDMAKELSMVERNDKGKEARQYFIECERQAKELVNRDPMEMLNDPTVLRQALLGYSEKVIALEEKVQEQAPKVEIFERIADATGSMTLRETATTLKYPERKMILWMQQNKWLYRRPGRGTLLGYAERIKSGHLDHKVTLIHNERTGEDETRESVRVTPLGLTVLAKRLNAALDATPVPSSTAAVPLQSANY